MEAKKEIILFVMGVFLISLVCAAPPIPNHFMGNVTLYGVDAPVGTEINVFVAGNLEAVYSTVQPGEYDLYVKTGTSGDTINFMINSKLAGTSNRTNGEMIILDLELITQNAPIPPVSPPMDSSGGGGGGGGGAPMIIPKTLNTIPVHEADDTNSDPEAQSNNEVEIESDSEEAHSTGFLTGAVTGTADFIQSKTGMFVFVIFLGMGVILIKLKPLKKWTKKLQRRYG